MPRCTKAFPRFHIHIDHAVRRKFPAPCNCPEHARTVRRNCHIARIHIWTLYLRTTVIKFFRNPFRVGKMNKMHPLVIGKQRPSLCTARPVSPCPGHKHVWVLLREIRIQAGNIPVIFFIRKGIYALFIRIRKRKSSQIPHNIHNTNRPPWE